MIRTATTLVSRSQSGGNTVWPVTLQQVKDNAQITYTDDDTLIHNGDDGIMPAAVAHIEAMAQIAFITQTRLMTIDYGFSSREIELPYPPLQSITSITYLDIDYVSQTVDSSEYRAITNGYPGRVALKRDESWPTTINDAEAISITYVCGIAATAADVNLIPWKHPIIALASYWWRNRHAYAERNMDLAFQRQLQAMIDHAGRMVRY